MAENEVTDIEQVELFKEHADKEVMEFAIILRIDVMLLNSESFSL